MKKSYSLFIFRRDLRLFDNTTLIFADKLEQKIIPIFIFDPHQIENKIRSNNCIQFMIESLIDLNTQLKNIGSKLHIFYGHPWKIIESLIQRKNIKSVYMNVDYTKYSKFRDNKIKTICDNHNINFVSLEDLVLHEISLIKTSSGKYFEKFTPFFEIAKKIPINLPQKYTYKHLTHFQCDLCIKSFDNFYTKNNFLYIHGGRNNALKILMITIIKKIFLNMIQHYYLHTINSELLVLEKFIILLKIL
jgi:deoxyribodipyrimidine photo-lyase